ncbi:MAG: 4-hydroxythreonine-4-phosphate dehydrogenase PdxA [Betaproteobacteria bacterium]|jgi:4-hydroxythreonine-4-phosphate dehydrogenase
MSTLSPIAITPGDPCGIGPEIIARAFLNDALSPLAVAVTQACFVAGDLQVMQKAVNLLDPQGRQLKLQVIQKPTQALNLPLGVIPVLQVATLDSELPYGKIHAEAGRFAGQCVVWAAQAALRKDIAAMVTAPLHKEALAEAGPPFNQFPGHTELLQFEAANYAGVPLADMPVRMMLANDELRVVLVSIHVSLRQALEAVTYVNVLESLRIAHQSLSMLLGRAPKIGVAGLNPHAGEGGLFGREEIEIIEPAMAQARSEGILALGPFAPDTVFMRARQKQGVHAEFDVVLAMYHDQGLIPVKYMGLEQGVNVTLGLPLVRTSPDHGTAFDISGQGLADPSSMVAAIRMARQLIP